MGLWSRLLVLSIFLCLLFTVSVPRVYASDKDDAAVVVSNAEEVLGVAFESVLEAEQAGADVSGLLGRMSLGGEYLGEANVRYRAGAYEEAVLFAGLCIETVDSVWGEAVELSGKAERLGEIDFVVRLFGSAVAVVVVGVTGFVAWRVFRRRYLERVFELKPEVVSGES